MRRPTLPTRPTRAGIGQSTEVEGQLAVQPDGLIAAADHAGNATTQAHKGFPNNHNNEFMIMNGIRTIYKQQYVDIDPDKDTSGIV